MNYKIYNFNKYILKIPSEYLIGINLQKNILTIVTYDDSNTRQLSCVVEFKDNSLIFNNTDNIKHFFQDNYITFDISSN